jgi:hypothetical protein
LLRGRAHAQDLGCEHAIDRLADEAWECGADHQRNRAERGELGEVIQSLAGAFSEPA